VNKRDVLAGMRCARLLWWGVHDRDAPELTPSLGEQDQLEEGRLVGRAARDALPGGVEIRAPFAALEVRTRETAQAIAGGATRIYEAAFLADQVFVAADVLQRDGAGWTLTEVKSGTSVRAEYLDDLAVQVHVIRAAGLPIRSARLMYLNGECRAPDLSNLFTITDVTPKVEQRLAGIAASIAEAQRVLAGPLPQVELGTQCGRGRKDEECPFIDRCWAHQPEHHVSTIYWMGAKWPELVRNGFRVISDLPETMTFPKPETARQVRAVKAGRRIVEPGIREAIAAWRYPRAFLDFETIRTGIPRYDGTRPWEQVPGQFSVHRVEAPGAAPLHHAYVAAGAADPRPELVEALLSACAGAATVVAYYAKFEAECLRHLAAAVPLHAVRLLAIQGRLVDPLPIIREHLYDPGFGGGFGLKRVLPVLVPDLPGYGELEVQEGETASTRLKRMVFDGEPAEPEARERLRRALLAYCELDTLAMVRLVERLYELP
jgi:hypothetical protein